jgi:DNA-binding CsgD family transcriptional regulator
VGVVIEQLRSFTDEMSTAEKVARDVLGHDTYADVEKRGSRLSAERFELERVALGTLTINVSPVERRATVATSSRWQSLSKAERDVAILAAAGWPNSAVAVRRGTSTRTADAQIASVFQKLMINSREEIIRFVPQDQRNQVSADASCKAGTNHDLFRDTACAVRNSKLRGIVLGRA